MEKRTFTLDSSDGKSKLSGFLFLPEGQPRAVVQICHGMCEYILRYEELAQHLTPVMSFAVLITWGTAPPPG